MEWEFIRGQYRFNRAMSPVTGAGSRLSPYQIGVTDQSVNGIPNNDNGLSAGLNEWACVLPKCICQIEWEQQWSTMGMGQIIGGELRGHRQCIRRLSGSGRSEPVRYQ